MRGTTSRWQRTRCSQQQEPDVGPAAMGGTALLSRASGTLFDVSSRRLEFSFGSAKAYSGTTRQSPPVATLEQSAAGAAPAAANRWIRRS